MVTYMYIYNGELGNCGFNKWLVAYTAATIAFLNFTDNRNEGTDDRVPEVSMS